MATVSILETERDYPSSDGKPMAETDDHLQVMLDLIEILRDRYRDRPDVYVSGDLLVYYEPGNKKRSVAPDIFVVFGVEKRRHRNYLVWLEGKPPDFVLEVTSKNTRAEDQVKKFALYRDVLKVPEYFLFDPLGDYLRPSLQGYRLFEGEYRPISLEAGGLASESLGVRLVREGESLRLIDLATGLPLLTAAEARREGESAEQRAETAEERAETAEQRAETAEERAAREIEARRDAEELARRLQAERDQALAELERLKRSQGS